MGKVTGFLDTPRRQDVLEPPEKRVRNYREFVLEPALDELAEQGGRCMDCGIPYCLDGCPVSNVIPDFNDLVYVGDWREAYQTLSLTNNFPEFTGRVCPAPCEASCTLNLNDDPVTIKAIELAVIERAFKEGWVRPQAPAEKTGKSVAVVGSGPAGMACAQQLARAGHAVVLYEKSDRIGGLLRYGIPDFKMEKHWIDRRMEQMAAEGVRFETGVHVGSEDLQAKELLCEHDAVALCAGCEHPRALGVPGSDLDGVHYAMDFLPLQNRVVAGDYDEPAITAKGKDVIVIGGGDTGSDCIGTSNRQGAASITQFELLARPPDEEDKLLTWPDWPLKLRTSSSHQEGCDRDWSISTTRLEGENGKVERLWARRVEWSKGADGRMRMEPVGDEHCFPADLVLLAMGYVHPRHDGLMGGLGLELDDRGNAKASMEDFKTSCEGVFAAGDMRRGQSLVVWAIREGRMCARSIDEHLTGSTLLPR